MFSRTRLGGMKTRNTEINFEEERQSMLLEEETIQLFVDPTPIAWPSFQEECGRRKFGSTYSSPDIKEFRPLLVANGRDNTSSKSPDYLQEKSLNRMPSRDANPWRAAVSAKPSGKVTLPKLLVFEDNKINSEQKQGRALNSKLRIPMDHLPLECPKINRSGTKNVQSRLDLFIADTNTNENQRESANTAGTDVFLKRTLVRNGISKTRRDIRQVSQVNKAKNDLIFSDLFVESGHVELSENTSNWLNCGESESTAAEQTTKANERGTQIYKTFSDEVYGNEVASRLTDESKDVVRELSKRGSDRFGDAQSQKSFVLVVDQLTDLRMRNKFVRQCAGRRRLAICEELEKGIVRDGQCLFELRKELTIANVLKNMFV